MVQVRLELSYIGRQALDEDPYRGVSRPYVLVGLLAMKPVGRGATVFVNAENVLDVPLSEYQPLVRPEPGSGGRWTVGCVGPVGGKHDQPGGSIGAALLGRQILNGDSVRSIYSRRRPPNHCPS